VHLVVRAAFGAASDGVTTQQRSVESWYMNAPGMKVVMPSNPADAKGLLKAAIRDDNPVLFLEHKALYDEKGEVPDGDWIVPLGRADIKRLGKHVTIVATARLVGEALGAAQSLHGLGVELEVIDPRTLVPLDKGTILDSVRKTHHLVVAHEATLTGGPGAEISAVLAEEAFHELEAPILRLAAPDLPISCVPTREDIVQAVQRLLSS
jgi:pyruvate dehydrogenase E1 component beta subunit